MELLELAAKLVSFDTVSDKTTVLMAEFISQYLQGLGFEIEEYPYEINGVRKVNLIARKGGSDSRLVLAGHMDTVPAGNWDKDKPPLVLTRKKDFFHGLGIADMKFFLAVAMKAGEAISSAALHHPFALCFTSDEEQGCLGAKKLVAAVKKQGRKIGDFVVIGEPTESQPIFAHKGYIYLEISVEALKDAHPTKGGTDNSAHSSDPSTTTNVVEKTMPAVIEELCKFKAQLELVRDPRFRPEYPTMNIGGSIIIGRRQRDKNKPLDKVAKNIIPRGYTIECDIRPVPGQDPMDLIDILKNNIEGKIRRMKTTVLDEHFQVTVGAKRAPTYPMETTRESQIVLLAEQISERKAGTVSFNTEGYTFNKAGSETVIWGPTDIRQAHTDNECVAAKLFSEGTVQQYVRLIRAMCVEGGE